jgi:hypothetical protein
MTEIGQHGIDTKSGAGASPPLSLALDVTSRGHGLEGHQVAYYLALLACGILFGLFVGGYVGFIETATPAADPPDSFAQLATSDVQWAAKARQDWLASHHVSGSAAESGRQPLWRRLAHGTATSRAPGDSSRELSPFASGAHFVRLDTPGFRAVKKAVVTR